MSLQETANNLKRHAAQFDLEKRAVECCKEMLQNLMREAPDEAQFYLRGIAFTNLKFAFVNHRLVFETYYHHPFVLSRVIVGRDSKNHVLGVETFGTYDLETGENGNLLDDWFRWNEIRDENGKLTEYSATQ